MPPPSIAEQKSKLDSVTSTHLVLLSFAIQLGLLVYANHVDSNPEKYGGLKYTDVDWRVVSDGARLIFGQSGKVGEGSGKRAEGWLINDTGLPVGE
jgi:phosphatidylinositol glycan class M